MLRLACCALLIAAPLMAEDSDQPLTAAEFEAATVGRTLYYNSAGQPYGAEQYLPDRKVVWAFIGDDCRNGEWYEDNGHICFVYEDAPEPQCWIFRKAPGDRLTATFLGDTAGTPIVAVEQSPEPMACMGPNLGV